MIEDAQSKWLVQLASMREAIAELKFDTSGNMDYAYGHDLVLDDEDLTTGSGTDDIWDISEGEEEDDDYSSDHLDTSEEVHANGDTNGVSYGKAWLHSKTAAFTEQRSGLDAGQLQEQVLALLASDSRGWFCLLPILGPALKFLYRG